MSDTEIQVIGRSIDLLELLATSNKGLSLSELASRSGLPKSTVHRILSSLCARHYVEKDTYNNCYHLGYIVVELASLYLNKLVLKTEAAPFMHEVAYALEATAYLGILENNEVMYLESVEQVNSLRMYTQIGKREPVYCTALGKVLVASKSPEEQLIIARNLDYQAYTDNSIRSESDFLSELKKVQAAGYAVDRSEHTAGSSCLAVPVYDYTGSVMAAMSISGMHLLDRFDESYIYSIMLDVSLRLSSRMGYSPQIPGRAENS